MKATMTVDGIEFETYKADNVVAVTWRCPSHPAIILYNVFGRTWEAAFLLDPERPKGMDLCDIRARVTTDRHATPEGALRALCGCIASHANTLLCALPPLVEE